MAPDNAGGFGLAFYDRIHGDVVIASRSMGAWETRIVDGAAPDGTDTGDVGMGTSLFIDSRRRLAPRLRGRPLGGAAVRAGEGGTEVEPSEVADDGLGIEGVPFEDGQHLIGDDANAFVTATGEVAHQLSGRDERDPAARRSGRRAATATAGSCGAIEQEGSRAPSRGSWRWMRRLLIANWWRVGGQTTKGRRGARRSAGARLARAWAVR